jgi:hypothetical protein
MSGNPANLQKRPTIANLAKQAGISERQMFYTIQLRRSGRTDLIGAVARGEMTVHAALQQVYPKRKDRFAALIRAWRSATDEERATFLMVATASLQDGCAWPPASQPVQRRGFPKPPSRAAVFRS